MPQTVRIALDAMGGDFGPKVTIAGAANALERRPDSRFLLIGDEPAIRAELAASSAPRRTRRRASFRRVDPHGRQAEPGAALRTARLVDVARDRCGQERRRRRRGFGRQHRRAHGHGENLSAHDGARRPSRARLPLADAQGAVRRARRRRLDGRQRQPPRRSRDHGRGDGAGHVGSSARPSACSMSAPKRSRASRR